MFRKLRLQFALINGTIIFFIFLCLTAGSYYFLKSQMMMQTEFFCQQMAAGIAQGIFSGQPPSDGRTPLAFFIKTDKQDKIISFSDRIGFSWNDLNDLARTVTEKSVNKGVLNFKTSKLYYYKTTASTDNENIYVLKDFGKESRTLLILGLSLSAVGLGCLILSLGGSIFFGKQVLIPVQKAWQQQKDFLADVSHQLRTPLTVIRTNLDIVIDNKNESVAKQQKWLDNLKEETDYMADMVNSLLFLASSDSGQLILDKKSFLINTTVNKVINHYKPSAEAKKIALKYSAENEIECWGDESRIRQTIEALLDNAVRHTDPGGSIIIGLYRVGKNIQLEISDTGEGIPPEDVDKIFNRFYQVKKSKSKGGAGLGLAIAKCIIENHQGHILVSSASGIGTCFSVVLPNSV